MMDGVENPDLSIGTEIPQVRSDQTVPLRFWFGPMEIATTRFRMAVEESEIDPFSDDIPSAPTLLGLGDLDGVYRPAEPLSPDVPEILRVTGSQIRYVASSGPRRFIDLTTSFETYLSHFSSKTRGTLRRQVRKLEAASGGRIDWRIYRSVDEMKRFHSLARDVAKRTYQEKLYGAGIPDTGLFLEEMTRLAAADAVRGFVLFLEGRPASYLYLPVENRRVIYGFLGFEPSFAKHSPGTVLQYLALENLFSERRYRLFDFSEGEGAHKRLFSTSERLCGQVFYLRPTMRNRVVVRLHLVLQAASDSADRLLVKMGWKGPLRRALRGHAGRN